MKEEALDSTLGRTHSGRGYEPILWQVAEWMDEWM